ncbi:hypothetical protein B484DRAFT_440884, partial [Ochromonadaceae sp. CCMP2298]
LIILVQPQKISRATLKPSNPQAIKSVLTTSMLQPWLTIVRHTISMPFEPLRKSSRGQVARRQWPVHTGAWEQQITEKHRIRELILQRSISKGEYRKVMRYNEGVLESFTYWRRSDARQRYYSHYRTAAGICPGRALLVEVDVENGEQLGEFVGDIVKLADYVDTGFGIDLPGGLLVLDCKRFAEAMICVPSMCNAYQGLLEQHTGRCATKTCAIVNGPPGSNRILMRAVAKSVNHSEQHTTYGAKFWKKRLL